MQKKEPNKRSRLHENYLNYLMKAIRYQTHPEKRDSDMVSYLRFHCDISSR